MRTVGQLVRPRIAAPSSSPWWTARVLNGVHSPCEDSWLKRSCQMSGELQNFELIYVPKGVCPAKPRPLIPGVPIYLSKAVDLVDEVRAAYATCVGLEDWEIARHQHVHLHRKAF